MILILENTVRNIQKCRGILEISKPLQTKTYCLATPYRSGSGRELLVHHSKSYIRFSREFRLFNFVYVYSLWEFFHRSISLRYGLQSGLPPNRKGIKKINKKYGGEVPAKLDIKNFRSQLRLKSWSSGLPIHWDKLSFG